MKGTLKFFVAASMMCLFALQLSAQGPGGGRGFQMTEEEVKERSANTAKVLGLNKEQQEKIEAVDMDFYNKMQIERQKMMSAGGPPAEADRQAMRDKMMKMRDDRNTAYEKVLTAEQYKKFLDLQEQRRDEMRQQRNPEGEAGERSERGRGRN